MGRNYKCMRMLYQESWYKSNFQLFPKWTWLNQPLTTKMLSVLFASVGPIGRFTLEKHHPKWCSSGFAFVFWPFEYPMDVLEFYLWGRLKYCLCISVFHQRNLVSSTRSQGVGSASASWVLGNIKDVINYCTVIDLGFLTGGVATPCVPAPQVERKDCHSHAGFMH